MAGKSATDSSADCVSSSVTQNFNVRVRELRIVAWRPNASSAGLPGATAGCATGTSGLGGAKSTGEPLIRKPQEGHWRSTAAMSDALVPCAGDLPQWVIKVPALQDAQAQIQSLQLKSRTVKLQMTLEFWGSAAAADLRAEQTVGCWSCGKHQCQGC